MASNAASNAAPNAASSAARSAPTYPRPARPTPRARRPQRDRPKATTRVLLIEDDPDDAFLIRGYLADVAGPAFEVVHAEGLELGLAMIGDGRTSFDVALLDLSLPDSRSGETLSRFRLREASLPVVVLTGLEDQHVAVQALHEGAQDYLVKTWVEPDLLARSLLFAIERKEAQEELETRMREQVAISQLSLDMLEVREIDALLERAVACVEEVLRVDRATLEFAPTGRAPGLRIGRARSALESNEPVVPGRPGFAEYVLGLGGSYRFEVDLTTELPFAVPAYAADLRPARGGAVPIPSERGAEGILTVWRRGQRALSEGEVLFLESVAHLVGVSLKRGRERAERDALQEQVRQSQKMEAVGRLAGGVAHDFNNLLTVVHGYAEMLLESSTDAEQTDGLEQILHAARQAGSLTGQLLAISRTKAARLVATDVNEVVDNLERMFWRFVGEDVSLRLHLDRALRRVLADPGHVEQVVLNLVINAQDAMPDGGELRIETRTVEIKTPTVSLDQEIAPGRYSALRVCDTGCGIPATSLHRVFEPFYTTKAEGKGTGLGLAIVHGLVRQHDGYLRVRSEVGRGSSFEVGFPVLAGVVDEPAEAAGEPAHRPPADELILIVDDSESIVSFLRSMLTSMGYRVLVAYDGVEALEICLHRGGDLDLAFVDVAMPKLDGLALRRRLIDDYPDLKVQMMTSDIRRVQGEGIEGEVLEKPFPLAAVKRCLARAFPRHG